LQPIQSFRRIFIYLPATLADLSFAILLVAGVLYGTKLGASTSEVGWIGSAYGFSYLIMPGIIGRLGDKLPRKMSLIIAAIAQISIALFYLLVAASTFDLILGQLFLGVANGFHWPALEAYISEETSGSQKAHARGMANFCFAWSIGYTLGPFLAGLFSDYNVQDAFLLVLCLYIINFLIVSFGLPPLKETKKNRISPELKTPAEISGEKTRKTHNRELYALLIGMLVYASAAKIVLTYFANYAKLPEGLGWSILYLEGSSKIR
jgi:MFS family permease